MKQVLFLIIIVSLISNLLAVTRKTCSPQNKMICRQPNIGSCSCVNKNTPVTNVFLVQICNPPKYPLCQGDNNSLQCYCAS